MVLRSNRDPSILSRPRCTQLPALTSALVLPISSDHALVVHLVIVTMVDYRSPGRMEKVSPVDLCVVVGEVGPGTAVFVGVYKCTEWHRLCTTPIRGTGLVTCASSTLWMGGQSHPLCLSEFSSLHRDRGGEHSS